MGGLWQLLIGVGALKVLYPLSIVALTYAGSCWFRIGSLQSEVRQLERQTVACEEKIKGHEQLSRETLKRLKQKRAECDELRDYDKNKPVPTPLRSDDSDLESLLEQKRIR